MTRIGPYEVVADLQGGALAELYLATRADGSSSAPVAIKLIPHAHVHSLRLVDTYMAQARLASRVRHPNVVHILDLGEAEEGHYVAMEYIHGDSVGSIMKELATLERRFLAQTAVAIGLRLAAGLHAAHETCDERGRRLGIVHCDVTPASVLMGAAGEVKLIELGVAGAERRLRRAMGNAVSGKLRYMAPEQMMSGTADRRSDVFSLGIVIWEMLTMRRLFKGASDEEVTLRLQQGDLPPPGAFGDVPHAIDQVVLDCLADDPERRPQSAAELERRLARAMPGARSITDLELAALVWGTIGHELGVQVYPIPLPTIESVGLSIPPAQALSRLTEPQPRETEDEMATMIGHMSEFDRVSGAHAIDGQAISSPSGATAHVALPLTPAVGPLPEALTTGAHLHAPRTPEHDPWHGWMSFGVGLVISLVVGYVALMLFD